MRCLLVEPLMLIFSLEDDDRKVREGRAIMNISSACLLSYNSSQKASLMKEFNQYRDRLMADVQEGKVMEGNKPVPKGKRTIIDRIR